LTPRNEDDIVAGASGGSMFAQPSTPRMTIVLDRKKVSVAIILAIAYGIAAISIVPAAQAQSFTLLHAFSGPQDGDVPQGGPVMDRAGNLYGTTTMGGRDGFGTVYKLSRAGAGWILTNLYTFSGGTDGGSPFGPVTFGPDGTLYGTTAEGGANRLGTVFNLRPPATVCHATQCPWVETVIHSFSGSDGFSPEYGGLIFDAAGNIYGTAAGGGIGCRSGCGLVYKLTKSCSSWTENVLYFFTGGSDGETPYGGVAFDRAGNLYGSTFYGGTNGSGTLFQLTNTGAAWTETTLQAFSGSGDQGGNPYAGPVLDQQGNLYGTTSDGGSLNGGTVYQLQPSGDGNWTLNVLYSFDELGKPFDTPTLDTAGNLYATTSQGGNGVGSVIKLTRGSDGWSYTELYDFPDDFSNGYAPVGSVVLDSSGNIYGTTALGGNQTNNCPDGGCGVVFEINTSLHDFCLSRPCSDGQNPISNIVFDASGNLYGTTLQGGSGSACNGGCGVALEITP
jgi:uncharacterized repeat protein (TIGR03803 family)